MLGPSGDIGSLDEVDGFVRYVTFISVGYIVTLCYFDLFSLCVGSVYL